jgi:hypothetical protein
LASSSTWKAGTPKQSKSNNSHKKVYTSITICRACFVKCLASRSRVNWTPEGVARAQYWYSRVLTALGKDNAAEKELKAARAVKKDYLKQYKEFLEEDPDNEAAVFDHMLPMWSMATSGVLAKGGANSSVTELEA